MRAAVILAAGRGTRMRSDLAKVLHPLLGRPLVHWVVEACAPVVDRLVVVVGHQREAVTAAVAPFAVRVVVQDPQEGTGHAVACAAPELGGVDTLLVLAGDVPLIRRESLERLLAEHEARRAAATVLTFRAADPSGYGRIVRGPCGGVEAVVEHADATPEQRLLDECNSGTWALDAARVLPLLEELPRSAKGEYYLTDVVALLREREEPVAAVEAPQEEALGVNTPEQLLEAERILTGRAGR